MLLANCRQRHCFDLSGLFRAVGDRQEAGLPTLHQEAVNHGH